MKPFTFSNRVLGAAVGVIAVVYLYLAFTLEEFTAVSVPVQPATLPKWLGAVLVVLAAVLFFQKDATDDTVATEDAEDADDTGDTDDAKAAKDPEATGDQAPAAAGERADERAGPAGAAGAVAARPRLGRLADIRVELALFAVSMGVYIALLEPLGFLISTIAYIFGTAWYLGYRRHWATALVAVGVPAALYFVMSDFLQVALPTGPLPF